MDESQKKGDTFFPQQKNDEKWSLRDDVRGATGASLDATPQGAVAKPG